MAASSFSIWWKFDAENTASEYMLYNNVGSFIRLSGRGGSGFRTVTAATKNVSITHTFSSESEYTSWHHYCFVQQDNDEALLYVDGELSGSVDNNFVNSVRSDLTQTAYVGGGNYSARFDDFRTFQRKLTFREAEYLYNGGAIGGRSELAIGVAPIDVAKGSESQAEAKGVKVELNFTAFSLESQSEVSALAIKHPAEGESIQSQAEASGLELTERKFRVDEDPLTVGDANSTSIERAVIEFDVSGVSIIYPVKLRLVIEDVVGAPTGLVRRWLVDFPTSKEELEANSTTYVFDQQFFFPNVGTLDIDISGIVGRVKSLGETTLRIALMEEDAGSGNYYEVNNSTTPPRLVYYPSKNLDVDDLHCNSESSSFNIPVKLDPESVQASSEAESVLVFSQILDDITSAQSQSNAQFISALGLNTAVGLFGTESISQAGQFEVRSRYLILGDSIDFTGATKPKPINESPLFGVTFDSYDPSQDIYSTNSVLARADAQVRIDDLGSISFDVLVSGTGQAQLKVDGSVVDSTSVSGELSAIIPDGNYYITIVYTGSATGGIRSLSLERAPLTILSIQSRSQVEPANVELNADADDIQVRAEVSEVKVNLGGFFLEGSFESDNSGWTVPASGSWERGEYGISHDGTFSMRADLSASSSVPSRVISYSINTNANGLSEFRGHFYLQGSFGLFGGVEILDGDDNIIKTFTGSNTDTNQWIEFAIETPKSTTSGSADDNVYKINVIPNPGLTGHYVHFDDFGFRSINTRLEATGSQSSSVLSNVGIGINNIGSTAASVESSSEAKSVLFAVPATTDSAQASSQASSVALVSDRLLSIGSIESGSEIESVTLSGDSVLQVDSAQSITEIPALSDVPNLAAQSQASNVRLSVRFDSVMESAQSSAQASRPSVSGTSVLIVSSAESKSNAEQAIAKMDFALGTDSVESDAQVRSFGVQSSVFIDPDSVSLCTPAGEAENVVTGIAGEDISKGEVVRSTGDDSYFLASAETELDSLYDGIAVTNAVAGEPLVVATSGTVIFGSGSLSANSLYVLSTRKGRLKKASYISTGEYISLVGIATDNDRIKMGADFQSLILPNQSPSEPAGSFVEPVDAKLVIEQTAPRAGRAEAQEEVVIGDVIARNGKLSENTSIGTSSFLGVAVSLAEPSCTYAYVPAGANVDLGSELLRKNGIYVVSPRRGKMMLSEELDAGQYATIVGIALTQRNILLGSIAKGTLAQ